MDWLEAHHLKPDYRNIKEQNPSAEELKAWLLKGKLPLKKLFGTSGQVYRQLELGQKLPGMSEDEQLALLGTNGMLLKRPLLVGENFLLAGFREAEWEAALGL